MAHIRAMDPVEAELSRDYLRLLNEAGKAFFALDQARDRDVDNLLATQFSVALFHVGELIGLMEAVSPMAPRKKLEAMMLRAIANGRAHGRARASKAAGVAMAHMSDVQGNA